jgi:predicted DNA-binding transcriptional regulator
MATPQEKTEGKLANALRDAGLTPAEIAVFDFLIRKDTELRVSTIARATRLNRSALYGTLKTLAARGLVSSSERNGVLFFQSIQPHLLVDYLERVRERLSKHIQSVEELVPEITSARKQDERYRPGVQFFDGTEGIKEVYDDLIRSNKEKVVRGFTGAQALLNLMGYDWGDRIVKKRSTAGVKWLAVAAESEYAREMSKHDMEQLRKTRFLPPPYTFDIELVTYDDKAALISFAEDHPWAMIITDKKIAETIKALFSYIESTLPQTK